MNSPLGGHHWEMKSLFDLPERIQNKIMPCPTTGCWLWIGLSMPTGYGCVNLNGRRWYCHRLMYHLLVGEISNGLHCDHLCRNRICCNPLHIEPVTPRENLLRSPITNASIGIKKTHCKRGHEFTSDNTLLKCVGSRRECRICRNDKRRYQYQQLINRIPVNGHHRHKKGCPCRACKYRKQ